ncbi:ead/Ea22-like family protein [Enterobacter sp. CPE_E1214]|uniref:ead/Ea22-like family protein n=1 Tax=unclassified Enterobacter TaxID=2608935 RepID=UPI003890292E
MSNIDKRALREAAEKATPGRIGDRIDGSGSIKYQCFGNDGSLVLQTDHKNMEYGFIGGNSEADELFFRLCDPATVLALLDELEAKDKSISFLKDQLAQLANFNPDWDKLEAATDSLREHMAELTAACKRIAELERKEQHSDRQSVIDALASSGEEWSDIEEYMQKWDAERAAAAGKGEAS